MNRLLLVLFTICISHLTAFADSVENRDSIHVYDVEHPLIYEDAWDLWPYVFLNEKGEPDGFNVDLLKMLFKELNIPYVIKLKPTLEAQADLKNHKSDLMFRMDAEYSKNDASFSTSIVQLFTQSVVFPKGKNIRIKTGEDLNTHTVIVHDGSFCHYFIKDHNLAAGIEAYDDMQEVIQKVSSENDGIIIWNTMSLKWLIQKYKTTNLEIEPFELPFGEYKFYSNDHHLLAQLDSVYAMLRATDKLTDIQNKWFYPEKQDTGIPSWIWNLVAVLAAISVGAILYYIIYKVRERKMTNELKRSNDRLSLILKTSHVRFMIYNVATQTFTVIRDDGKTKKTLNSLEFSEQFGHEEFIRVSKTLKDIIQGKTDKASFELTKNMGEDQKERYYNIVFSVLSRDKHNKPTVIICSKNDITEEVMRHRKSKDTMLRYQTIFNTGMVSMILFDENGYIKDVNERILKVFKTSKTPVIAKHLSISDITGMPNLITDDFEMFYATMLLTNTDKRKDLGGFVWKEKAYYEFQVIPVFDDKGKRIGFFGTGREVTEVAHSYKQLLQNIKQLEKMNAEVSNYIKNIDYVLTVGGVSMVKYNVSTHILTVYSEINHEKYALTQTRLASFISEESKKKALRILNKMDGMTSDTIQEDLKTVIHKKSGVPLHLQFHFFPSYENGKIKEYFGMCRDISDIKALEEKLAQETLRAQEVEIVKNAFLHNMSHEIRTPLTSVVGFAELFEMEHTPEEETVFIDEIKHSSAALLKLINDILFLSRLDAGMITINHKPIDFAKSIDLRCKDAWASHQVEGVDYIIKNPYKKLVIEIDEPNVAMVLDKIVTNAAQNTKKGQVLVRYDYIGDELLVSVEDTGKGIPEAAIKHIFERFVTGANTGAGLGLSICHELINYMGGEIQLKSTEGKGTTVWFTLPCKLVEMERI